MGPGGSWAGRPSQAQRKGQESFRNDGEVEEMIVGVGNVGVWVGVARVLAGGGQVSKRSSFFGHARCLANSRESTSAKNANVEPHYWRPAWNLRRAPVPVGYANWR